MRTIGKLIVIVFSILIVGSCFAAMANTASTVGGTALSTSSASVDPAAVEDNTSPAHITFDSSCEYLLDFDNGHQLVASAFLSNDGGEPGTAVITATWRQAGGKALTKSKTVTVPAGASDVEVQLQRKASAAVIDRIQAVATDKQCTVDGSQK